MRRKLFVLKADYPPVPDSAVRSFWRDRKGASFVEFAIIAIPLFLLFIGIIEVGLIFWATYELENATADAARLVRTGQARSMTAATLKAGLCSEVVILSGCTTGVRINIQVFPGGFGTMTPANPIDSSGKLITTFNGDPSQVGPGQDVLVTAYYEWPLADPLTQAVLSNLSDGNCLIRAAAAFRSEPFPG
ncbi:MAG: TadE/TadG family type IV pilus assembly protein [Rhodomicrobium sp.]